MNIEDFREYCLSLPATAESLPFDEDTLVMKVGGKMFAYASIDDFRRIALKCDPDKAIELRERHAEITPSWHSSKRHWNDVATDGSLSDEYIRSLIFDSYMLVVKNNVTPKAAREAILRQVEEIR